MFFIVKIYKFFYELTSFSACYSFLCVFVLLALCVLLVSDIFACFLIYDPRVEVVALHDVFWMIYVYGKHDVFSHHLMHLHSDFHQKPLSSDSLFLGTNEIAGIESSLRRASVRDSPKSRSANNSCPGGAVTDSVNSSG